MTVTTPRPRSTAASLRFIHLRAQPHRWQNVIATAWLPRADLPYKAGCGRGSPASAAVGNWQFCSPVTIRSCREWPGLGYLVRPPCADR